ASAQAAAPAWRALPGAARGEVLRKAARLLEARAGEIAETMTREMGKTLPEARGEVMRGVAILHYYAAEGMHATGEHLPSSDGRSLLYTRKKPLGTVALITPWNFPVAIPLWKLAPALVYGNTAVLKPASNASVTAALVVETLVEAGMPAGVVNLVHGPGGELGAALLGHPAIEGVSFTGSNAVGRTIGELAARRGIKCQLEMGGKNAVVVLADANLDKAADAVVSGAMKSTGQKCTATSKVIVERGVKARFTELLLERLAAITPGDGLAEGTYFGPLATARQRDTVLAAVKQGQAEGARLLLGGGVPEEEALRGGHFVQPALFDGVTPQMQLATEEIFGPVLGIMEADDLTEAVALANGTAYGLSAAIFTSSLESAMAFVEGAEAGMIKVNAETAGVEYHAPFGGLKASSSHSREQGRAAMDFFTHTQTISISV
ncbi:aldehyde dehydrogenase family protein, partial [Paenibacillus sp. IB182496]